MGSCFESVCGCNVEKEKKWFEIICLFSRGVHRYSNTWLCICSATTRILNHYSDILMPYVHINWDNNNKLCLLILDSENSTVVVRQLDACRILGWQNLSSLYALMGLSRQPDMNIRSCTSSTHRVRDERLQYSLGAFVTSITSMPFMTSRRVLLSATWSLLLPAAALTLVSALLALSAPTPAAFGTRASTPTVPFPM